jgi:hypothetical protein
MADSTKAQTAANGWAGVRRHLLWAGVLSVVLFDCWLIADQDVVAVVPLGGVDDGFFMSRAMCGYWFDEGYHAAAVIKEPIYPLFIYVCRELGLPLRRATEAFYLTAAGFLAWCLTLRQSRAGIGLLVFAACALHPLHYYVFQRTLYDTIYSSLLMVALSGLLLQFKLGNGSGRWERRLLTGVALGLLWNTRPDRPWVLGLLIVFLVAAAVREWYRHSSRLAAAQAWLGEWILPLSVLAAITLAVKGANYARWGIWVTTDQEAPGYVAAQRALMSIKPEHPRRGVPILRETVQAAYTVSPSLGRLAPFLDQAMSATSDNLWSKEGLLLPPGEDGPWFGWDLRRAMGQAGHYRSAPETDHYYRQIADEIQTATADGRLPGRWIPTISLDPCFADWLPLVIPCGCNAYSCCFESDHWAVDLVEDPALPGETVEAYNRMARRCMLPREPNRRHARVRQWISIQYSNLMPIAVPVAGLVAVAVFLLRRVIPSSTPYLLLGAALGVAGFTRLGFVALADANVMASPPEPRIYFPAALLLTATAAWLLAEGVRLLSGMVLLAFGQAPGEARAVQSLGGRPIPGKRRTLVTVSLAFLTVLLVSFYGLQSRLTSRRIRGNFDAANDSVLVGWAWEPGNPRPVAVDIYDGEEFLATVAADQFRPDLIALGYGDGKHGFRYPAPARLRDGQVHTIRVEVAGISLGRQRVGAHAVHEVGAGER